MTLILTASDLAALADMEATIEAVERSFADLGSGLACQPGPTSMHLPSSDARYLVMAGASAPQGLVASKLLSDIPANGTRGLPTQRSSIVLADAETGETLALLDGRVPTRIRTAAASAVATRRLARSGSTVLGLVGAGALAVAHLEAIAKVAPIETVVVWSRSAATIDGFRRQVEWAEVDVVAAASPQEAVQSSDILCTLTPSEVPIVHGTWFGPGLHVNAVGARPRPTHREVDAEAMRRSRVVVDSLETALAKSGDLLLAVEEGAIAADDVAGELGQVLVGSVAGRESDDQITLFNSVGIGLQDLAIGRILYDAALQRGVGLNLDLGR
ncbi:ornithine cyclodeaminase family protein [Sinomonas sp. ASV322]|uniref:ornithine cyclodeaminase family protein n=1 Tax=Sinomonas sp. ASV322 TaxID=3041920 RepID=UPI0027DD4DA4|nr:ornithine cyclodeaminase family protein [Sinomonas sp. ASV322]MDQ4504015.1 ornithine cyclodeaminase family protein [Sinomonas sp. ASV322]